MRALSASFAFVATLAATLAGTQVARAENAPPQSAPAPPPEFCPAPIEGSPAIASLDARVRLAFIRGVMRDQAKRARTWMWGWSLGGLGLAAGNYAVAAFAKTKDDAIDPIVGGTTSFFIPAAILVKPLRVSSDDDALEEYIATTTTALGPMQPCRQLALAEELLALSADDEALGVGVLSHAIAIGGNAAIALFLGLGFHHWGGGLLNGLGGLAISEAEIFMQPTGAVRALEKYRAGGLLDANASANAASARVTWSVAPLVLHDVRGTDVRGLSLAFAF